MVNEIASLSPSERFNSIIEGLYNDVATRAYNGWFPLALHERVLVKLIWRRLRRMNRQFAAIMARCRAGILVRAVAERPAGASPRSRGPRPGQPSQRYGWVIYAISWFVWNRHYELKEMLEEPEIEEMVAAAPEFGRVFRPMCRMLAVKPPAWLRLPRKPRPSRAIKHPPAPEFLVNAPGAIHKPDGSIWLRIGASANWRPGGAWETLELAQKFDPPIRIWPRRG